MQTLRFASSKIAARYPLRTSGPVEWVRCEGGWSTAIALDDVPNDHILVPSFCEVGRPNSDFFVELQASDARWLLSPMRTPERAAAEDPRATTHIDYFHSRADLAALTVTLTVASSVEPAEYLLTLSIRPFRVTPGAGTIETPRAIVPPISQLSAPRAIRYRICSPTCVLMLLQTHGRAGSLAGVTRACLHPATGMFGVWPLAVRTLANAGLIAAVECFDDVDAVAPILERGLPLVASIRFAAGALPGSPLNGTDGHLVVVTGADAENVWANDPAARDASTVPREYSRAAFAAAWLTERGATYVALPL